MSLNQILMFIMGFGVIIGAIDYILDNKWGLGTKFEEGFMCLGPTALSMVGMICLAPFMAGLLKPIMVPLFKLFGADPAMFASILAIDMGGYPLAMALAENKELGEFAGVIVASMLGVTIVFNIPVGLSFINKEDHIYYAKGLLIGLIPVPIGSIIGGILMGLPLNLILLNIMPTIIIAIALIVGLIFRQEKMVSGFQKFGKAIKIFTIIGLGIAAFTHLTGIEIIPNMPPIMTAMQTVSGICIILLGSLPLMALILKVLSKPFEKVGNKIGLDATSMGALLFSLISVLPVFAIFKDMNERGKIVTTAFFINATAVFAAHLGYVTNIAPTLLGPMIIAKLSTGLMGLILALLFTRKNHI